MQKDIISLPSETQGDCFLTLSGYVALTTGYFYDKLFCLYNRNIASSVFKRKAVDSNLWANAH